MFVRRLALQATIRFLLLQKITVLIDVKEIISQLLVTRSSIIMLLIILVLQAQAAQISAQVISITASSLLVEEILTAS